MPYYGRIYFEMNEEEPATYITLQHVASADHLVQFANVISGYTRARVTHVEFIHIIFCTDETSTGDFDSCLLRGIVKFRDADRKLWAVPIPAPIKTMFEEDQETFRVKDGVGQILTAAYSDMAGSSFEYEHGWLVGNTY